MAVDETGTVRWSYVDGDISYEFRMADPAMDASGNIFVVYNPGRYYGTMVIRPTSTGIDVIAGTYWGGSSGQPAPFDFYYTELTGPDASGLYGIVKYGNDCNPNCANGTTTAQDYTWNGTTYVGGAVRVDTPGVGATPRPSPTPSATPSVVAPTVPAGSYALDADAGQIQCGPGICADVAVHWIRVSVNGDSVTADLCASQDALTDKQTCTIAGGDTSWWSGWTGTRQGTTAVITPPAAQAGPYGWCPAQ